MTFSEGIEAEFATEWERYIPWNRGKKIADRFFMAQIHNGEYIQVKSVDFSKEISSVEVTVATLYGGNSF